MLSIGKLILVQYFFVGYSQTYNIDRNASKYCEMVNEVSIKEYVSCRAAGVRITFFNGT